jgi:hypothetical protein
MSADGRASVPEVMLFVRDVAAGQKVHTHEAAAGEWKLRLGAKILSVVRACVGWEVARGGAQGGSATSRLPATQSADSGLQQ